MTPAPRHRDPAPAATPGTPRRVRGFTLVETLVSLTILGLLMGALGSVFVLSALALPTRQPTVTGPVNAARAVERIVQDVVYANAVTSGSDTSLSLTVPDRNGDAADESVTFSWDGRRGSPLIRTLNGSVQETLLTNVRALSFGYRLRSVVSTGTGPNGNGPETAWLSIAPSSPSYTEISSSNSFGQSVRPVLPVGTTSWSISRVTLRLRVNGATDGVFYVQVRTANANGSPQSTVLGQVTVLESSISGTQQTYTIPGATGIAPTQNVAVCLVFNANNKACDAAINSGASPSGSAHTRSTDKGSTWAIQGSGALVCTVYGYAVSPTSIQAISSSLDRVTISVQADDDNAPTVHAAATPLNRPGVLP